MITLVMAIETAKPYGGRTAAGVCVGTKTDNAGCELNFSLKTQRKFLMISAALKHSVSQKS